MLSPSIKVEKLLRAVADGDLEMVSFSESVFLATVSKYLMFIAEEEEGSVHHCRDTGAGSMRQLLFTWVGPGSKGNPQRPAPSVGYPTAKSRLLKAPPSSVWYESQRPS